MRQDLESKSILKQRVCVWEGGRDSDGGEAPVTGWDLTSKHIHAKLGNFDLTLRRQRGANEKKEKNRHKEV